MKATKIIYYKDMSDTASDAIDIHDAINLKQQLRIIMLEYGRKTLNKVNNFYIFSECMPPYIKYKSWI